MTETHIDLGIVDLEGVDVLIVFINLVWQLVRKPLPESSEVEKCVPLSTPTTDVKRSPSELLAPAEAPGVDLELEASSCFFSTSFVPGITKPPLTGALAVVNVVILLASPG